MAGIPFARAFRLMVLLAAGAFIPSCHDDDDADHGGDAGPIPSPAPLPASNRNPSLSGDGQRVAFESDAADLTPGDTNGVTDVFVFNRVTGEISLVSVTPTGDPADDLSTNPLISADGRFVVFESFATNLVLTIPTPPVVLSTPSPRPLIGLRLGESTLGLPGIGLPRDVIRTESLNTVSARRRNIFVRDLATGQTVLVSIGTGGLPADGDSSNPSISQDGRFITFETRATNLVDGVTLSGTRIVVRDLLAGQTSPGAR